MSQSVTVESVLRQCLVAFGSGTRGVSSTGAAIDALVAFFQPKFQNALQNDPLRFTDVDLDHRIERIFVLRCAEMLGRIAAHKAALRGDVSITPDDVDAARCAVVNKMSQNPGDWCN